MFGFKKKKVNSSKEKKVNFSKENLLIIKGSVTRCGKPVSPLSILSEEDKKILEEKLKKQAELRKKKLEEIEKRKASENWIKI